MLNDLVGFRRPPDNGGATAVDITADRSD
jgi:hypothetical protein